MIEIQVTDLVKSFAGGDRILNGITFQVYQGERVGLLGKNGGGKTTLFKILTGEYDYDGGEVSVCAQHRVGLISQIPVYPLHYTVENVLNSSFDRVRQIERELEDIAQKMQSSDDKALLKKYGELQSAYEAADGYNTATALEQLCQEWNISSNMLNQAFDELSGGEKTRINLGRLILENTDILLLDEPTNHLDLRTTKWLEQYLLQYKGTVLTISHDRYFLDKVVTRIIELDGGKAEFYSGNYTFYTKEKEQRYQEKLKAYNNEQNKIAQLEEAADKLSLWAFKGMDKTYKQVINIEKRIERIGKTEKPKSEKKLRAVFDSTTFKGDEMLSVKGASKSFEQKELFTDINLLIRGGERIAILGDNGTGKSTLLKIILGQELPDRGKIIIGPSVKIGYLPQNIVFENEERTLLDVMIWEQDCLPQIARDRLASFKFVGDDVYKTISSLSGGERSRLSLCILMDEKINLLILDEPTNHLDIYSREWIENAVEGFTGTLLFVSHDRYFIERFATHIWEIEGCKINIFEGDYNDFQVHKAAISMRAMITATTEKKIIKQTKQIKQSTISPEKEQQRQISFLENSISELEQRQKSLHAQMAETGSDYKKLNELHMLEQEVSKSLAELYEQWEILLS